VRVLAATAIASLIALRLRIAPVVGLLVAGALIGPSGLGWIEAPAEIHHVAEIGVVLLLFVIGLEFSRQRLRELGRPLLVGGSVQVAVTVLAATGFAAASGLPFAAALVIGFVVCLSSTALVLKLYGDRGELDAPHGRAALGILIFQDLAVVVMIVLVPALAGGRAEAGGGLLTRLGGGLVGMAAAVLIGRWAAPRLLATAARRRSREAFVLAAIAVCVGMAWLSERLGLSPALGAFLGGVLLADSDFAHQTVADMVPLRDVFASLFFVSVGMLVDLGAIASRPLLVAGTVLGVVALKAAAASLAGRALGLPARTSVIAALGLAQVGEFSFLLLELGRGHQLLTPSVYQLLLATAALTMLATPVLVGLAPRLAELAARLGGIAKVDEPPTAPGRDVPVVIVGFGANGRILARILRESGIGYAIVDGDPDRVRTGRADGEPIEFGDASRPEILRHAGVERASVVVVAISDPGVVLPMVGRIRELAPRAEIIVRTRHLREIERIERAGADRVVAEEYETAIEIYTWVLRNLHVPANVIAAHTRLLRGEDYRLLRGDGPPSEITAAIARALEKGTTDVYRILDDGPAAGRTLAELDLRRRTGVSVIAVVRQERPVLSPGAEFRLERGDDLVLVGAHAELEQAWGLLREPTAGS